MKHYPIRLRFSFLSIGLVLLSSTASAFAQPVTDNKNVPKVEIFLKAGKLAIGERELQKHLIDHPEDDQTRFGLGTLQFLRSIERMSQSFYKYALLTEHASSIPLLRVVLANNPNPEKIDYKKFRNIFETLLSDLTKAEATLSKIKNNDINMRLHFGLIRLDLDGDGTATDEEMLINLYAKFNRQLRQQLQNAKAQNEFKEMSQQFAISFDRADAYWLQGYCHLLMGLNEFVLAHDWEDSFNRTGQLWFPKKENTYPFLKKRVGQEPFWDPSILADAIAFIHLLRFDVTEPKRSKAAMEHFEQVFKISRLSFKAIQAEADDNEEWIPGPKQTGVVPGVKVTEEMIREWHLFLDEMELIFAGKKLIPHYRLLEGKGINLRKYFLESKHFDLVLLLQGTSIGPFVEEGEVTERRFWQRLERTFGGNFIGFTIWFN